MKVNQPLDVLKILNGQQRRLHESRLGERKQIPLRWAARNDKSERFVMNRP